MSFRYQKFLHPSPMKIHCPRDVAKVSANSMAILNWGHVPTEIPTAKESAVAELAKRPKLPWLSPRSWYSKARGGCVFPALSLHQMTRLHQANHRGNSPRLPHFLGPPLSLRHRRYAEKKLAIVARRPPYSLLHLLQPLSTPNLQHRHHRPYPFLHQCLLPQEPMSLVLRGDRHLLVLKQGSLGSRITSPCQKSNVSSLQTSNRVAVFQQRPVYV